MKLVDKWRTLATREECLCEKPTNWPIWARRFHLGSFWSFCSLASRTNTGHPHTWQWRRSLSSERSLVINSNGVRPDRTFGTRLETQTKCFTTKDQRERSSEPLSIQCREAWTIKVHAIYMIVWIARSARAFWCWAPMPENSWFCCFSSQSRQNS